MNLDNFTDFAFEVPYASQIQTEPYIGQNIQVEERIITTPEGPKPITTIEKRFRDKDLQGMYIPGAEVTAINKVLQLPWLSVRVHEDDHRRFENYYTSGIPIIDELTNRRVADKHYNKMAIKYGLPLVDTAGDLEKQIRGHLKIFYPSHEVEDTMREVWKISDCDLGRIDRINLNVEGDYKKDLGVGKSTGPDRDLVTGEYRLKKKIFEMPKINPKIKPWGVL